MSESKVDDFNLWLEGLTTSVKEVTTLKQVNPPHIESLRTAFEELLVDLEELEKCRPTASVKKPYAFEFSTALPVIMQAKRLIPTTQRILRENGINNEGEMPSFRNSNQRRIPELEIAPFDGDITLYASFKKSFHLKYDSLPIPKCEKLQHLKGLLQGEPKKLIQPLDLTDANYDRAMRELDTQYNNIEAVISALYAKLEALPVASNNTPSLRATFYELEGILTALESHGQNLDVFPPLRDKVYFKYPQWLVHQICGNDLPNIKDYQKRVGTHLSLRAGLQASAAAQGLIPRAHATTAALTTAKGADKPTPTCVYCTQTHYSAECPTYTTVTARRAQISGRCLLCFKTNHLKAQCTRNITCYYCKQVKHHHSSLCPTQFPEAAPSNSDNGSATSKPENTEDTSATPPPHTRSTTFITTHQGAHCTALITIINPKNQRRHQVRTLFDNGSNETYISEAAARRIGLELSRFQSIPVNVFHHDAPVSFSSATTSFIVTNGKEFRQNIVADTAPNLPQLVRLFDMHEFRETYPEYSEMQFVNQGNENPIELLLGSDYFYDFLATEKKITVAEGLHIFQTPFGYILVGRQHDKQTNKSILFQMSPAKAVQTLCDLESIGIRDMPLSTMQQEEQALNQFYDNIELVDNRYQIRLPWKQYPPPLVDNFGLAVGRLKPLLRRFDEKTFEEYNSILQNQLDSNIIEEVSDPTSSDSPRYYLPHHSVIDPEKSTPLRIVFDGSAKAKNKYSINDAIYKGSNLLAHGAKIIIRFRLRLFVIISDIEKAFHQLLSHPDDRNYLMFVFVRDFKKPASGKNLRFFRFLVYVFGIIASPFVLNATLKFHLKKYRNEFTDQMEDDTYVDGLLTGFKTKTKAEKYYQFAVELFKKCSMNLRKWASNDASLRNIFEQPDKSEKISILGLIWNQYDDMLHVRGIPTLEPEIITLRNVLSKSAQFFDPCGYWSPITINAKIFLRDLHTQYSWDDELTEDHRNRWRTIFTELQFATQQKLQRYQCDLEDIDATYSIHAFADASAKACACVIYLVQENGHQTVAHLLFARTKLAKVMDIPKLELIAAFMALKAMSFVCDAIKVSVKKRVLWSDSTCVLSWIENDARILPVFIQRRIDEIRNVPNVEKHYITGTTNPADMPSRGVTVDQLLQSDWFKGPIEWIQRPSCTPPPDPSPVLEIYFINVDETPPITPTLRYPFDLNADLYNSYLKLLRFTTYLIRFVSAFTISQTRKCFSNSPTLYSAQLLWVMFEQRNYYSDVIEAIENKKAHPLIRKLNLCIDPNGFIRCAGRFQYAPLSPQEKSPILLPPAKSSKFVRLLVQFYHESNFHSGTGYTLSALRRRFWLPVGRHAVYHLIKECRKCRRFTARPYAQPQDSTLPQFRLDDKATPFQNVGIDTFGHFWVNNEKRYCLIVTDLVIRAVDMELLTNMTTEEIFLAFRRIIARRSTPKLVVSDNAPQFTLVKESFDKIYTHEYKWKSIPEHAPWMGGVYERVVGLIKSALFKTFHNIALSDALVRTALAEIAALLNSRPLTYVPADSEEMILTPNHFLKSYYDEENETAIDKFWKQSNEIGNLFWNIWKTSYLQWLRNQQLKSKQTKALQQAPKINDVVIIVDNLRKRNCWNLGKVVELNYSSDNDIRSVKVKTKNGIITRPVCELCMIESAAEADQPSEEIPPEILTAEPDDDWDEPIITVEEVFDDENI